MSRWWLSGLLTVAAVCPLSSQADEPRQLPPIGEKLPPPTTELPPVVAPAAAPGCASCAHTVSRQTLTLVPEQTAATRERLALRESVQAQAAQGLVVEFREEKQSVTEMVLKPRECEQVVIVNLTREVPTTDPVTGKVCKHYETYPEQRVVKVTVFDLVPVTREVIVRIPCLKTVDSVVLVKKLCAYPTTEAVIEMRLRAEFTNNDFVVPVCPVPVPIAVPCLTAK